MKKKVLWSLLVAGLFGSSILSVSQAAGDPEAGKKKYYTCEGCHGVESSTNAYPTYHVPRLGGQHADYVVAALEAYQKGERKHSSMLGNAASMSEQDMQDIAAFVSKFKGLNVTLPVTGNAAAGKDKVAACGGCHGEDGNNDNPMFPRLAGQYESYIVKALQDYKSGKRSNPMMAGFAAMLSDEEMKDVAAYYASQKKGLIIPRDN
ncbi:Cytochrome c553 [Methylomagnum ishizawai]|uniref:Cytochrome c553 n=1 Tax=Methylomagnum ishizawai TaxID=1760988 RepID=A0A1Y6CTW1_9GAMM|nr:cytochrome c [Methylomagnum ishizawai]SMF94089.1 Cytochrome c553 [Methylomagnum ishizawai]